MQPASIYPELPRPRHVIALKVGPTSLLRKSKDRLCVDATKNTFKHCPFEQHCGYENKRDRFFERGESKKTSGLRPPHRPCSPFSPFHSCCASFH